MRNLTGILFLAFIFTQPVRAIAPEDPENVTSDTVRMENVVVTGSRTPVTTNNLPMSVTVVTQQELENRLEQSVLPILVERVPSLMITSRSVMGYGASTGAAGAMTMRGIGGGAQMLMLIDGHPQFMGIFSHPLNDTYQTLMAERVEVVRGPASVLYGANAMGGVINILTRGQQQDGVDTRFRAMYGSYNTLSTEATNTVRSGKFNSVLSLGYNRSDGHRDNMDFEQYSGYAKVGYDFSRHWKSFVDFNLSQTYSSNPGAQTHPMFDNDMDILRGVTSFSLANEYQRTSGALKVFYNFGDHFINDGYDASRDPRQDRFNSTDWMLGVTLFQNYSLWSGNQTTVGMDFQRYGGHAWTSYLDGREDNEIATNYMNDVAGYVNFQQRLWSRLTLNAGIRLDHHTVTGNEWIPQFGASWFAGKNTTVKGIVSKGYRNPTLRELYMWAPANEELQPENMINYEFSLIQYLLDGRLNAEVNFYYIEGKNTIIDIPADNYAGWMYANSGKVKNHGLEFLLNYRVNPKLNLNANYSYIHTKYHLPAVPEHKFYAGADYHLKNWRFSTALQYVDKLTLQEDDPDQTDSFLLWSARVSFQANKRLNVFVRGENLLDQKYSMYTGYPMPGATVFGGISLRL